MIVAEKLSKYFGAYPALSEVSMEIAEGEIFGLIGTNGAGKSTFLRIAAGIWRPDAGQLLVDDEPVYEHVPCKQKIFYISDDQHFLPNSTAGEMLQFYQNYYPKMDVVRCRKLLGDFGLEPARQIRTYSKGMKKQLSMLYGICSGAKYLYCDETFDGLDSVMRQAIKSLMVEALSERGLTPVLASHSLRELEDICDFVGLMHRGGVLLSKNLQQMKENLHRVQFVLPEDVSIEALSGLKIIHQEQRGRLWTMTVRGSREELVFLLQSLHPVFLELIPLSLEEIFISETEVAGYDLKSLIL